jgi:DNA invertase Pin-like site-specific DNA recombinase
MRTYAYVRVSTEAQSCSSQEFEINRWAEKQGIRIDCWVRESVSGTVPIEKRLLGKTLKRMRDGDMLVSTEISRLGRNMLMIMSVLNTCAQKRISIHTIKDNFDLSNNINSKIIAFAFALAAEIERNLISQRMREALADRKAAGVVLGRPKGSTVKKAVIESNLDEILRRRAEGESLTAIAYRFNVHRNTLFNYLKIFENI